MILSTTALSTEQFTYSAHDNTLTASHSDLGSPVFERVYDDACDVGLTLVSHRTGREVVFVVEHEERRDGDLLFWKLGPADEKLWAAGTVIIFND